MKPQPYAQAAQTVLMIRPKFFGFNHQTAGTNIFQNFFDNQTDVSKKAVMEFDRFVALLQKNKIDVIVINDQDFNITPDAVFPNNWFSTHHDGKVILYPLLAANRRLEVRPEIFKILMYKYNYPMPDFKNYTDLENEGLFLEGTGSLVFDHANKIAYANISSRTSRTVIEPVCRLLNYEPVTFYATSSDDDEIYHTNVLLTVAENFAVICAESIITEKSKKTVVDRLASTGHEIILITYNQVEAFAGNMLQVRNKKGELVTIMSQKAYDCLEEQQLKAISKHSKILPVSIPVIERVGGGSVRCMMAEIFLPKTPALKKKPKAEKV
ncbi:MAG: arginine deiminase-related protein [Bacteroidia bacterium]